MYHPYRHGYSVLPQLQRIKPEAVFDTLSDDLMQTAPLKRAAAASQVVLVEQDCPAELKTAAAQYLLANYPLPLSTGNSLEEVCSRMAEDVVIHRLAGERDWMAFGAVYFPSSWRPEDVVGKSFLEIHAPVPGIPVHGISKLLRACIDHGPFERFVWNIVFSPQLNFHPDRERTPFNPQEPQLWVKVERQVLVGLPGHSAFLFLLKQSLLLEDQIDKPALVRTLEGMTPSQKRYKGILDNCDLVVRHLHGQ